MSEKAAKLAMLLMEDGVDAAGSYTVAEAVSAFRAAKNSRAEIQDGIGITFKDKAEGLNARAVKTDDAKAVWRVFDMFASKQATRKTLAKPLYDKANNTLVATTGTFMLVSDIPAGFSSEKDAAAAGFETDWTKFYPYQNVVPKGGVEVYGGNGFKRIGGFAKGDAVHNHIAAAAKCATAYENNREGTFHTVYLKMGRRLFSTRAVADMATALFKLGCDRVDCYVSRCLDGENDFSPIHMVGRGGGLNARGLLCRIRTYGLEKVGAFTVNIEDNSNRKAA